MEIADAVSDAGEDGNEICHKSLSGTNFGGGNLSRSGSVLQWSMPLVAVAMVVVALRFGSFKEIVVSLEAAAVLLVLWLLSRSLTHPHVADELRTKARSFTTLELLLLGLAVLSLVSASGGIRPIYFFIFIIGFYIMVSAEAMLGVGESTPVYAAKLFLGLTVLEGSFTLLYPGFAGTDPYRDFLIASSIISHGGGLPLNNQGVVWYDFSPMAPLNYAIASLMSGIPLRLVELSSGIGYVGLTIVSVGCIMNRIASNLRLTRAAMVLSALFPFITHYATWPIPSSLALPLACLVIMLLLKSNTGLTLVGPLILGGTVVLTYGGIALSLLALVFLVNKITRSKANSRITISLSIVFIAYAFLVYVRGAQLGALTMWSFFLGFFTLAPSAAVQVAVGSNAVEIASLQYPWIFIAALSWVGLSLVVSGKDRYRLLVIAITVVGWVSLFLGVFTSGIIHVQNPGSLSYIGLLGFPLLCVPASVGLVSLMKTTSAKRVLLWLVLIVLVVSAVTTVSDSPDFWQGVGSQGYAASARLSSTTTLGEQASQLFLDNYDTGHYVQSNFQLFFTNITGTGVSYSIFGFPEHGWVTSLPTGQASIILISLRAVTLEIVTPYPQPTLNQSESNLIYSSSSVEAFFVPK